MVRKVLRVAAVLALCVAVLLLTPGLLDLILNGNVDEPVKLGDSTLTEAEILISPEDIDPSWVAPTANYIKLEEDKIEFDGLGAVLSDDEKTITVNRPGTYVISGTSNDGQILVDVLQGDVQLVLNGASLRCSWSAPIYVKQASKVQIVAQAGSENTLTDTNGTVTDPLTGEPSAVIYSADDLFLCGSGSLRINANYREAVHCKDRLTVADLHLELTAPEDGIVGHDALLLRGATVIADCGMDCLKSNNYETGFGYIYVESGTYELTSETDAIQAEQRLLISGGNFDISAGDGYTEIPDLLISQKGVKAGSELVIRGGQFFIDATDDAIHTDGLLSLAGGELTLYTGDDALSGKQIAVRGGKTRAASCVQGIVGEVIQIADGAVSLVSQDDGVLARPSQIIDDGFSLYPSTPGEDVYVELSVSGGLLTVQSEGDALDVRGELKMSGGFVMLNAPFMKGGDPLDYDKSFTMTGGTLVTTGRATYTPVLPTGEDVCVLDAAFTGLRPAGELLSLRANDGRLLFAVSPAEDYYNFAVYSCEFGLGSTCSLMAGGTPSEEEVFGVALGGSISNATTLSNFTVGDRIVKLISRAESPLPDSYPENPIL